MACACFASVMCMSGGRNLWESCARVSGPKKLCGTTHMRGFGAPGMVVAMGREDWVGDPEPPMVFIKSKHSPGLSWVLRQRL